MLARFGLHWGYFKVEVNLPWLPATKGKAMGAAVDCGGARYVTGNRLGIMKCSILPAHSNDATDCNAPCRKGSLPNTQSTAENNAIFKYCKFFLESLGNKMVSFTPLTHVVNNFSRPKHPPYPCFTVSHVSSPLCVRTDTLLQPRLASKNPLKECPLLQISTVPELMPITSIIST